MDESLLMEQIVTYCKAAEPQEACGFVILSYQDNQRQFLPCENIAEDPEQFFEIDVDDFVRADSLGEIIAVVHSHPNGINTLSMFDKEIQRRTAVDWWLVCNGSVSIFEYQEK